MDIPNLSANPTSPSSITPSPRKPLSIPIVVVCLVLALTIGFWGSRFYPLSKSNSKLSLSLQPETVSTENITDTNEIKAGVLYGDSATIFKDSAVGTIEKGSINGVGTHILNREGGATQRASLTSSVVDLDLFLGKKVEVKGETNASKQTSWLLDVGSIKVVE